MQVTLTPGSATHEFACHSKACAPPPAGQGGSDKGGYRGKYGTTKFVPAVRVGGNHVKVTHTVRKHSTPNFIDVNKVRHIKSIDDWTKKGVVGNRHPAGETGHARAFIDRVLGVQKYPKRRGPQKVLTRDEARAKGAHI